MCIRIVICLFKDFIYLPLERGERKEKERERNTNVWLSLMRPLLGTWPTTQACALTGNGTGSQAGAQSTEPHQPGLLPPLLNEDIYYLGFSCSVPFCHLDLNFYFISAVPNLLNILKFAFFEV